MKEAFADCLTPPLAPGRECGIVLIEPSSEAGRWFISAATRNPDCPTPIVDWDSPPPSDIATCTGVFIAHVDGVVVPSTFSGRHQLELVVELSSPPVDVVIEVVYSCVYVDGSPTTFQRQYYRSV